MYLKPEMIDALPDGMITTGCCLYQNKNWLHFSAQPVFYLTEKLII